MIKFVCLFHCIALVYTAFSLTGCTNGNGQGAKTIVTQYALVKEGAVELDLAYDLAASTSWVQTFPAASPEYLYFFHRGLNTASVYDLDDYKKIAELRWQLEGPNAVGPSVRSGYIASWDTIFLYSFSAKRLYLYDSSLNLKRKYIAESEHFDAGQGNYLRVSTQMPLQLISESLIFSTEKSYWNDFSSAYAAKTLNLVTSQWGDKYPMPQIYRQGWYEHFHTRSAIAINYKTNEQIVSYAASDNLQVSSKNHTKEYKAASGKMKISPIRTKRPTKFSIGDFEQYYAHIAATGWYAGIFYNPWKNLYYRFGYYPVKGEYKDSRQIFSYPFVIVLNHNFEILCEKALDGDDYLIDNLFVDQRGLHIFNKRKYEENEDKLTYDTFVLKEGQ